MSSVGKLSQAKELKWTTIKPIEKAPENKVEQTGGGLAIGAGLGLALCVALGSAFGNVGLGIAFGLCFGTALGIAFGSQTKP